jgi:HK97 family phage major capsid protein/HK97 family phage prohead protease
MHEAYGSDAPEDRTQEQATAMCFSAWREVHGGSAPKAQELAEILARWKELLAKKQDDEDEPPDPEDGETHQEYMDRCTEDFDEDECQVKWEDRGAEMPTDRTGPHGIVHKTHSSDVDGMDFILSDETPDRMGDIIQADAWDFKSFAKNPIALFNHNPSFPIGRWQDLKVDKGALRGKLIMAPAGTSNRIDEIRKLIEAGILKAVSVGFRDVESIPLDKKNPFSGLRFLKAELVETSLVSVPANPNALAIAKSLGITPATIDLAFVKHDKRGEIKRREFTGKHADTTRSNGRRAMNAPLAERISKIQELIVQSKDLLAEHWENIDQTNVSDADIKKASELNASIASLEQQHAALVDSERILAGTAGNGHAATGHSGNGSVHRALTVYTPKPEIASPAIVHSKKELEPLEYLVRAATVGTFAKLWGKSLEEARLKIYGEDEAIKASCELVLRAASAPAMTTVTGWAAELVQQRYADLMPLLMPKAILTRLAAKGLALSFGTAGRIIIPTRSRTPTLAGSFVGEGLAIPVRQGAFTSQTLVPKKMAVISTWTREMGDHSSPAIEGLIREAIQQDTSVAVDSVLIDANPATAIRPAGLLNGVSVTTATAGGGLTALIGDIKALIGALTASTYGNLRSPVFLMNPSDMLSVSLTMAANTGIFPFRAEIAGGTLNTVPVIDSATVPLHTVILVDAADFVVVGGEGPRMELSDQATLHMEDTSPAELVASPSTVAAPQRSLFQTDSIALRMVLPLNWVQRRSGTVAWTQAVTW